MADFDDIELHADLYPWQEYVLGLTMKYNVWVVPRGHGKTFVVRKKLVDACLSDVGDYLYVCPELKQARRNLWDDLKRYLRPLMEPVEDPVTRKKVVPVVVNEQYSTVEFYNGSKLYILGADDPENLRGKHPKGIVIDETQDIDPAAWDVLEGAHKNLQWVIFIGTPKSHNFLYQQYQYALANPDEWFAFHTDAHKLKQMSPEQLEKKRQSCIFRNGNDAFYRQEFLCDFDAAVSGAFYASQMQNTIDEGRITDVAYDPSLPVWCAWDIGNDCTAVWFAQFPPESNWVHIIDYQEHQKNNGIQGPIREVLNKPYVYGGHIGPHDSSQRDIEGRSKWDVMANLGIKFSIVDPKLDKDDGIDHVRMFLKRCKFDKTKCAVGIESLKQYRPKVNKYGVVVGAEHDKYSHGADAFRYLAVNADKVNVSRNSVASNPSLYRAETWDTYGLDW